MKKGAVLLLLAFIWFSCEEEFSPNTESTSIPVVYGVINYSDSAHLIRLTKTFQTDYNLFNMGIPEDELFYKDVSVRIERWLFGNFVQDAQFIQTSNFEREQGLFPDGPVQIFKLDHQGENWRFFNGHPHQNFRLIIDIPDQPVVYSEIQLVFPIELYVPRRDGRVFNMNDFKTRFINHSNYIEIFVRLHYINRYPDSISYETATWREFHDYQEYDVLGGKEYAVPIEGIALYDRIGRVMPNDPAVSNRKFEYAELIYNCLDNNLYRYNQSLLTIPSDQAGRPYSNIVNGIGVFGSNFKSSKTILFDYRSIDELCNGKYTKHLKFVHW